MARQGTPPKSQNTPEALRALPSIDVLARALAEHQASAHVPTASQAQLTQAARTTVQTTRAALLAGDAVDTRIEALVATATIHLHQAALPQPRVVINATGVIINTNLGRAPLSQAALEAIAAVGAHYSALEYDLERGERGSRHTPVRRLLTELVGAEDALAVNNNAAAMLVTLSALAHGREVIISRGELVEIGGGFRIPEVLVESGARLVEVGTTNRTRLRDFAAAITPETALLLSVHPSNYRIVGFTETPSLRELAELAHQHHLPLIHDLGSGALLRTEQWGLTHEPMPQESMAAGADLVCFSGDKLLGGPQAGILAGSAALIAHLEHHPLMRAVRIDKLTLAGLIATLRAYRDGTAEAEIPVWRMIGTPESTLKARAQQWVNSLQLAGITASTYEGRSTIGGGSMPGETLPTWLCALAPDLTWSHGNDASGDAASALASRLRSADIPVVARVSREQVLLDPRTVLPEQDMLLLATVTNTYSTR